MALAFAAGCGGEGGPSRSYSIGLEVEDGMEEYEYVATDPVDVRVGDEVTFELTNTGALIHDLNVVDPEGRTVARAEPVAPGMSATITATFDQVGFYRISCFVDDHLIGHQMFTFVEVTDPDA